MKAAELCSLLGVSLQTASSKARIIEDMLKIGPFDPRWCMPKIFEMNPLALLISIG
jgi:hypothetical protein